MKKIKFIDNEKEYNFKLYELGILDDLEYWELFQIQEEFKKEEYDNYWYYMKNYLGLKERKIPDSEK